MSGVLPLKIWSNIVYFPTGSRSTWMDIWYMSLRVIDIRILGRPGKGKEEKDII
jgi:hypothetical protein